MFDGGGDKGATGTGGAPVGGAAGASYGSGGTSAGTGGSSGTGGSGTGGSAAGTGGIGGAAVVGCSVSLSPVPPQTLDNLVSGKDARVRMVAVVSNRGALTPTWTWTVNFADAQPPMPIEVTPVGDPQDVNSSTVDFPVATSWHYRVRVDAGLPHCFADIVLTVNPAGPASYSFHVTPPGSLDLNVPAQESQHTLDPQRFCAGTAKRPCIDQINLVSGDKISISPRLVGGVLLPSFVRVSLRGSTVTVEGDTADGPVDAFLLPNGVYDILTIPHDVVAPALWQASRSMIPPMTMDAGMLVEGTIQDGAGGPLTGARVALYVGDRPSTVGISDGKGFFSLRTRAGIHAAVIVPPASAGLPDARVSASPGITIVADTTMNVTWKTFARAAFSVTVKSSDGINPVVGSRVRAELLNPLGSVATVRVSGLSIQPTWNPGDLHSETVTDVAGVAAFPDLPTGTYKVWVVPPAMLPGAAVTITQVELTASGYQGTIALSPHLTLSGTMLPIGATTGVRVIARDESTGVVAPVVSAIVGDMGGYSLSVDPLRTYLLVAEPPPGFSLARTMFRKEVNTADTVALPFTINTALAQEGSVMAGGRPIGGAVVQVYCVASPSAVNCLNESLPIAEALTRADGTYTVALPAPSP